MVAVVLRRAHPHERWTDALRCLWRQVGIDALCAILSVVLMVGLILENRRSIIHGQQNYKFELPRAELENLEMVTQIPGS